MIEEMNQVYYATSTTTNHSFRACRQSLQDWGIDNNEFMMITYDKDLINFEMEDLNIPDDDGEKTALLNKIREEAKKNIWFFFRELAPMFSDQLLYRNYKSHEYPRFDMTPDTMKMIYLYSKGQSFITYGYNYTKDDDPCEEVVYKTATDRIKVAGLYATLIYLLFYETWINQEHDIFHVKHMLLKFGKSNIGFDEQALWNYLMSYFHFLNPEMLLKNDYNNKLDQRTIGPSKDSKSVDYGHGTYTEREYDYDEGQDYHKYKRRFILSTRNYANYKEFNHQKISYYKEIVTERYEESPIFGVYLNHTLFDMKGDRQTDEIINTLTGLLFDDIREREFSDKYFYDRMLSKEEIQERNHRIILF